MQDAILVLWVVLALTGSAAQRAAAAATDAAQPSAPAATSQPPAAPVPQNAAPSSAAAETPKAPAGANPAVPAPTAQPRIVKSIEFEGNHKFKAHVLRERLGFQLGDRLDPFLAEGGRVTIMEVYRKIGYVSVQVTLDHDLLAEGRLLYTIEEGPRVRVENIDFAGNESFSAWTLREVIKLRHRKWLFWPTYYTEDAVKEDVNRLRDFYYGQGYLDHKITAQTEFNDDRSRVDVIFLIEEGPLYYVGDIVFAGQTKYTAEQLQAKTKLRVGDVYKKPRAEKDAKEISQIYREQGYVDAEVRQEPHFTPEKEENTVAVTFTIREGRQFRLGQIDVTGNEQTRDKAVRRILDEYGFTPGQLYNAKIAPKEGGGLLEKYVGRGVVTEQATIRPVTPPPGSDPNIRDARVDIKEGMTGRIQPGVGFSSDAGFIGQLIYEQRNFDITDTPKSVDEIFLPWKAWRGGGEVFSVRLEPGTRYSAYTVDYVNPYFNDQPVTFDTEGRWWKWFRESYDETRLKGAFGFEQRLPDDWRRSIGFRAENVGIGNLSFDAPREIQDVRGHSQLFGVRFGVGKSAVDDIYDPTKGWRANVSYEQVTGDFTYGLLEGNFVRYLAVHEDVLGRKTVLANSLLAATTVGDAPPFERYYAGGSGHYGIRGFEYRGVSRRGLQTNVPNPERKYPIGSDWIFLAKSELIIPLVGHNFNGLLFLDSGTVDSGGYRVSAGVGIEIKLPQSLGNIPMRFELGFPILKSDRDQTQVFSFSGGGLMGF